VPLGGALPVGEGVEPVNEALGMHPESRFVPLANPKLPHAARPFAPVTSG
jgi:hypothetical protein